MAPILTEVLLLGIDGGGTRSRARLTDWSGRILGEATAGPANVRLGLQDSLRTVVDLTRQCLIQARLAGMEENVVACFALAGACEPCTLSQARAFPLPFRSALFTSDAKAACIGAHGGRDGAITIVGTGSVGWATIAGRDYRAGGWGFPLSDRGSGAWLGSQALAEVLNAQDGLRPWTSLLRTLFDQFRGDPYAIVRWMRAASPRDYASFAPAVAGHAGAGDSAARELMLAAAANIDALAARMAALGAVRMSLLGGLSDSIRPYLAARTRGYLVAPIGDAVHGALQLARMEAQSSAQVAAVHD